MSIIPGSCSSTTFVQIWHFCLLVASEKTRITLPDCGFSQAVVGLDLATCATFRLQQRQTTGQRQQRQRRHSAPVHKFESWSDSRLAVFFFECHSTALCEEGACRFCAKWLVWDRADHISSEGDRLLVGRAFGSSANSASRGVGDRPLCSCALTHGPSGQRQRQCQYRALFLPSRDAFNRGLGAAFVVVITTASRGASMQR